jgi:YD repeat-containing protein
MTCLLDSRRVAHRYLSSDGTQAAEKTWTYTYGTGNTTTVVDPNGDQTTHTFDSSGLHETQTQIYQGSTTLLKTIAYAWDGNSGPIQDDQLNQQTWDTRDSRVTQATTTLNDVGQVSAAQTDYNTYSFYGPGCNPCTGSRVNPVEIRQYDFGSGAHGSLLRRTHFAYLHDNSSSYSTLHILDRVTSNTVYDGATGQQAASIVYEYDNYTSGISGAGAVQHDSGRGTGYLTRGNVTATERWRNTDGAMLTTRSQYDDAGNVVSTADPLGYVTSSTFSGSFDSAYVTQVQYPTTTSPNTTTHIVSFNYDFNTGFTTSQTDLNGQTTSYQYDSYNRLIQITYPQQSVRGSLASGKTVFNYWCYAQTSGCSASGIGLNLIQKADYIDATTYQSTWLVYDLLGRQVEKLTDNQNGTSNNNDRVDTCYNNVGLVGFQSYTYLNSGGSTASTWLCSGAGDTFAYDAIGRQTRITHGDGTHIDTTYTGRAVKVADEGNGSYSVTRNSQDDALGRMTSVCEVASTNQDGSSNNAPSACGLDVSGSGFKTTYSYDALGDLTSVAQPGLATRSFAYDSLSQLLAVSSPEAGTTANLCSAVAGAWSACYGYDDDGNVTSRVRPRPNNGGGNVTTTYAYDGLRRLRSTSYSPGVGSGGYAPNITYCYDETTAGACTGFSFTGVTNTNGRVSAILTSGTAFKMFSYDSMGRVIQNSQCTVSNCGAVPAITYGYDLVGNVLSTSDGVGHTYTATYNLANRLLTLTSSLSDTNHPGTLLSNLKYGATGLFGDGATGLNSANINGTILTETRTYQTASNTRGFLTGITVKQGTTSRYSVTGIGYAADGDITVANDSIKWQLEVRLRRVQPAVRIEQGCLCGTDVHHGAKRLVCDLLVRL